MIIIIGAGISGLALAWHIQKKGLPYRILESTDRPGGCINTLRQPPYLFEEGPNSLLLNEKHLQFINELGLDDQLMKAADVNKNRFVYKKGKYRKLPTSPPALLFNNFFSWKTKKSIFTEYWRKNSPVNEDESVANFFRRRFTAEIVEYAVNPFVAGIYAGDPEKLLMSQTFNGLKKAEKKHGSVIKGMMKEKKGTARRNTYSFVQGISTLTDKLAEQIPVEYSSGLAAIQRVGEKTIITTTTGEEIVADRLVLCLPAFVASDLLKEAWPDAASALGQIQYPPLCCVHTVYKKDQVSHALDGFGGLNPQIENQFASGSIWSSSIFADRAAVDEILITSFVGGVPNPAKTELSDEEIKSKLTKELSRVYSISGVPVLQRITRWKKAIPQYDAHMIEAQKQVARLELDEVYVCANWQGGVSVVDCIEKAEKLAARIDCGC